MISDVEVREYPLKDEAAHLVGYVQNVTAEDLEKFPIDGEYDIQLMRAPYGCCF